MEAFGWSLVFPNSTFDLLATLFVGHPFGGSRRNLWLAIVWSFFWTLWGGRNGRLLTSSTVDRFFNFILAHVFNWCYSVSSSNSYSLSFFLTHWRDFL